MSSENNPSGVRSGLGSSDYRTNLAFRHLKGRMFYLLCLFGSLVGILLLVTLINDIRQDGFSYMSKHFFTNFPSRKPEIACFHGAIMGTLWVMGIVAITSFPIGVGAALYLEEYAKKNKLTSLIQTNISNLAGVPSIVFGILGLQLFVRGTIGYGPAICIGEQCGFGRSVMSGALTLTLLILPIEIVAAQEAIKSVPPSIREASYGVGATKWQTVSSHVLPQAMPGIMTGMILALSRAIGETAPIIMIGALTFVAFRPEGPLDPFTAMPIQVLNWISRPQAAFHDLAATGIVVLLVTLLTMNTIAVLIRVKLGGSSSR